MKTARLSPDTLLRLVREEVLRTAGIGEIEVLSVDGVALTGETFPLAGIDVRLGRGKVTNPVTHIKPKLRIVAGTEHETAQ